MAQKKKKRKMERADAANEAYEDAHEEEAERKIGQASKKLQSIIDADSDPDSDVEDPEEYHQEPKVEFKMKNFIRTASNGTLFKKHKYRKRWSDDDRYQPKEVFIKVNFDAETNEPLRITWGTGNRHVEWETVKLIAHGLHTPTYTAMKQKMHIDPRTCFSVVSTHTILDVQSDNAQMVLTWVTGLRKLLGQSDEEAEKLSEELRKHPPTAQKKRRKHRTRDQSHAPQQTKQRKDRTESLILLQKDLFILTTTTVFRNLEEQYFPLNQEIKNEFNPNDLYKQALNEDISWRKWQPWLTEKIINRMREKGLLSAGTKKQTSAQPTEGQASPAAQGDKDKDCVIS